MRAVENVSASVFVSFIREHVEPGSTMHMDEFKSYLWLDSSDSRTMPSITSNGTLTARFTPLCRECLESAQARYRGRSIRL